MNTAAFHALCNTTFALLGSRYDSPRARAMLFAIGMQESRLTARRQHGGGPARGLWQFERGGGVVGVLEHEASSAAAVALCVLRDVEPDPLPVWAALATDDVLACGFARLLLWTDRRTLPAMLAEANDIAWSYYIRNWRPGKPHRETWDDFWLMAIDAVGVRDA
jgi:hypothetical protein